MRQLPRRRFLATFLGKGRNPVSLSERIALFAFILLSGLALFASQGLRAQAPDRIHEAVDPGRMASLANHPPLWANTNNDLGALPANEPMSPMTLVLSRGPAQEQALQQFIEDQQNPASPAFHQWLTPAEVGDRFGLSDADLAAVTGWLEQEGLHVDWVSPSRVLLGFSGAAGAVGRAFGSEVHAYRVDGERRISVAAEPAIPQALRPIIAAVRGLYTIEDRPLHHMTPVQLGSPLMT